MFFQPLPLKKKYLDLTESTQVNAGATRSILIQPNQRKLYRIIQMYLNVPAIVGSAGDHHQSILSTGATDNIWLTRGTNVGTSAIIWNYNYWGTSSSATPSTVRDCQLMLLNCFASYDYPLTLYYNNATDTNQTGQRKYIIECIEYIEGE